MPCSQWVRPPGHTINWKWKGILEFTLTLEHPERRVQLFGPADVNLRLIRDILGVHISARDGTIKISGRKDDVSKAAELLDRMQQVVRKNQSLHKTDIQNLIHEIAHPPVAGFARQIDVYVPNRTIEPRTEGQKRYIQEIEKQDLVFCTGPAGTGKTYLAVAMAVSMLKKNMIRRMILARPAVEAGEKLGFLPGDLEAKVNPYLRPLFDALGDMMDYSQIKRFLFNDVIEVIPLAFMRGRTLNSSVVILDEAQNTTIGQMLMFLTRLGHDSKMIVTGDESQIDLDEPERSGLVDACRRLHGIHGISIVHLGNEDIVRHRLVSNIVKAYERNGDSGDTSTL